MLTDEGLLYERAHLDGVQRVYRWKNGGLSLVNSPMLHSYGFAWEAAVLKFEGKGFSLTYDTPLSDDVEVFDSDHAANDFIQQAKEYFEKESDV